jgi:hypothetical protein
MALQYKRIPVAWMLLLSFACLVDNSSLAHSQELGVIGAPGLIVDLDADKGITLESGDRVSVWRNQIPTFKVQEFVKRDEGRSIPGSGRPVLRKSVAELNGHNSLIFRKSELVSMDSGAFDGLITGSGYTWVVVMTPYAQISRLSNVNVFLGNLKNGDLYEGFWAGLDDDDTVWMGSRNGITFGRYDQNNPKVVGPRLRRNQYYVIAGRMGAGNGVVPIEIFVDSATPAGSQPFSVNQNAQSSRLCIGQERDAINHPGNESFDGELARVLIYARPLNDDELSGIINALKLTYFDVAP